MRRIQQRLLIQLRQPSLLNRRIHGLDTAYGIVFPSNIQYRNINLVSTFRKVLIAQVLLLQKGTVPALWRVETITAHPVDEVLAELCVLSVRAYFRTRSAVRKVLTYNIWEAEVLLQRVTCTMDARVETLNVVFEDFATIWVGKEVPKKVKIGSVGRSLADLLTSSARVRSRKPVRRSYSIPRDRKVHEMGGNIRD